MGLDITVKMPIVPIDNRYIEDDNFYVIEENDPLSVFNEFIISKENSYYDLETVLKQKGYEIDKLEWAGEEYGENVVFKYYNMAHPLYRVYKWLDEVWSKTYFPSIWYLKQSEHYKHFIDNFVKICEENGWARKYKFFAKGNKKTYYNLVNIWKFCRKKIHVKIVNPPTINRMEKSLVYEEVGYQRKGANKAFYDDRRKDNIWCVINKDELYSHWEKYFSDTEDMKQSFKESIIDKFIEGKTFVTYSW